jgi:hypothetical protein
VVRQPDTDHGNDADAGEMKGVVVIPLDDVGFGTCDGTIDR